MGPRPTMGRVQCAETPGLQPFLVVVRGGQGSHGGARTFFWLQAGVRICAEGRFMVQEAPLFPAAMSAFLRIRSALPPEADVPVTPAGLPVLTRSSHSVRV